MPNISFDIFYNDDLINITASRAQGAPKVKPGWKARAAPKISQKEKPTPQSAFGPKAAAAVSNVIQNAPQYAETLQGFASAVQQQANQSTPAPKAAAPNLNAQTAQKAAAGSKPSQAGKATSASSQVRGRSVTARQNAPPKLNGATKKPAAAAQKKTA
ncbi:MAG: hypothetical protein Q9227_003506 [Pyrenula ochraceoflavens]